MQKPNMIVGQKGVKYGLHVRQPKQQEQQKPAAGRLAAFSADSDSDEDVGAQVARQAARKVADSKVQEMYAAALAEDPNAFDYDGVYDSIQQERAAPKAQDKVVRQPKYIANLLEQAQLRKREQDITNERRLLKERQKEDHEYGDSEKFITSAYRKKLEEDKKWQESQALRDLEDERNDVTKLGHMNNFFHNLTRNVALGGAAAAAPRQQPSKAAEADEAAAAAAAGGPDAEGAAAGGASKQQQRQQDAEHVQSGDSGDEQQVRGRQQQQPRQHSPDEDEQPASRRAEAAAAEPQQQQQQQSREQPPAAGSSQAAAEPDLQQQQQQQQAVSGKRKNDDASVAAARERYLARKRQQLGA